jgi:hypothetical protein
MRLQRFMEATAIVLGLAALLLIFAPELALAQLGAAPTAPVSVLAQLYGAALFGLALSSWIARTMLLGGIYGRAIVLGGFGHGLVGAFALLHALRSSSGHPAVWVAFAVYVVLALAFGALLFGRGPGAPRASTSAPA